jgi:hypothetical protein
MKKNIKEEFDINIKDNFIEEKLYKLIYNKIPFYTYGEDYKYEEGDNTKEHLFYGSPVEKNVADYLRERCEKLYNKKFKENYTAYTMVARTTPMVHADIGANCTHQVIVYIRGDESLHRGTGFYVNNNGNHELNTHIGFKQNRGIFWESSAYHSPLIWSDNNQSKRFSIIAQYKEI